MDGKPARPAGPAAERRHMRLPESAMRMIDAQAKLDAHMDAQREREIAALESIAKSLEVLAKSADLLQRLATNRP